MFVDTQLMMKKGSINVPTAKILIIDDEAGIRLTLEDILSRDGYEVMTASSGQAALDLINSQTFDLALIDIHLGDMLGTEVLTTLKEESPKTVAIMLTAYASLETAVEALRQGAHDYLFKPCQTVDLRQSVREGLQKVQQEKQRVELLLRLEENLTNTMADIRAAVVNDTPPQTLSNSSQTAEKRETSPPPSEEEDRFLERGELIVDFSRHVVILDGELLELSLTEFGLMTYLISEAPRAISPKELVYEVQGYESDHWEASETVRSHIYHIRQKIKKTTGRTDIIRTVRGVGYTIDE